MAYVYIVEMYAGLGRWEPTVGAALSRADGRRELRVWRAKNCGRFRLARYRLAGVVR